MRNTLIKLVSIILVFLFASLPLYSSICAAEPAFNNTIDNQKVLETRFLNMLNHNYVYNDSFQSLEEIVNNSVIALLEYRDNENEDYISQAVVNSYLYDMYGITISSFSEINSGFPQKNGFVYILPRGYSLYEHEAVSLEKNEDGTFTLKTKVTVSTHDASNYTYDAETIFVKNEKSLFGYNIVNSVIDVNNAV